MYRLRYHYLFKRFPQLIIIVLSEGIEVVAQGAGEQDRVLRYDGDDFTEVVESDLPDVDSIDEEFPRRLKQTKQRRDQRTLTCSSPTHNSNLGKEE